MTEYKCNSCGMVGEADEWIYKYDEHYDELYIVCPECGGSVSEYDDEEGEEEEEEGEEIA